MLACIQKIVLEKIKQENIIFLKEKNWVPCWSWPWRQRCCYGEVYEKRQGGGESWRAVNKTVWAMSGAGRRIERSLWRSLTPLWKVKVKVKLLSQLLWLLLSLCVCAFGWWRGWDEGSRCGVRLVIFLPLFFFPIVWSKSVKMNPCGIHAILWSVVFTREDGLLNVEVTTTIPNWTENLGSVRFNFQI